MKLTTKIGRLVTAKNIKVAGTLGLAIASLFGFVKPETATRIRNEILAPIGIIADNTGDL